MAEIIWTKEIEARFQKLLQVDGAIAYRSACLLGTILFAVGTFLDLFSANEHFFLLSWIRYSAAGLSLILFLTSRTRLATEFPYFGLCTFVGIATLAITAMCMVLGGYESPYYAGVGSVFVGVAVLVPYGPARTTFIVLLGTLIYWVPILIQAKFQIFNVPAVVNNFFFLGLTGIIGIYAAHLRIKLKRESFKKMVELEKAHDDLMEFDRLKSQLFANISHELRTPLTLILGMVEHWKSRASRYSDEEMIDKIRFNAATLLRHVNDLLDISKVESGKMPLQRKPVNIVESFKRTTGIFQVLADEKKIDFSIESPDELWASVDDDKIERILMNLLSNAFKFVPSGCKICSRLKCENDLLIFEVEDNGPGIDPALREKVFDRFYQADAGDSKNFGGTGLGLSIVKDFAQLHGGTATILGSNRGGVLARIEIPWLRGDANLSEAAGVPELHETKRAAIKELQVANEDNPSTAQNVNADVLVIEDHLEMRDFLKQSLESECSVFAAANAAQALVYLKSHAPKLIVTDLMMPGMSGADFFKELLKDSELKSIPVMFLTAKADEHIRLEMISLGAFDYLLKPFSVDELRLKVRNALILIRSKQTLQSELKMRGADLSKLALEIVQQKHELELALKTAVLAREDAIESSKAKAGFLNMVSHELRTPLSVITMTAEFLSHESDRLGEDRRRQLTQTLLRSSQSLKALVETLLEYSRIKKGKFVSKMNAFDVLELVTLVTNEHRPLAEAKGLQLSVTVTQNETISTDRDLLRLVLSNLVSNAIKYTNSGAISLTATREENDIRIAVEDTGIGIESKYLDKIFDEFERVPGPSSFVPGMGLGLSLVKSLLAAVNGNISVNSTLGKGSRFDVLLRNVCQDLKQTKIQQGLGGKK